MPIRRCLPALATLAALATAGAPAQANLLLNGSFEATVSALTAPAAQYCYGCANDGWSGSAVVMKSTSGAWGAPLSLGGFSYGNQLVGLQNNTHVEQSLDLVAGTYLLTWADAGRRHYGATRYDVLFGNSLLNATSFATLPGQAWSTHSLSFTASGPGALRFQGLAYSADGTAFIDNLSLTLTAAAPAAAPAASTGQVPEPTSFGLVAVALMLAGLGGRAGLRRRVSVAG